MSDCIPVPTTKDDLLAAALTHANEVSGLLNDLFREVGKVAGDKCDDPKWSPVYDLLLTRFGKHSGLPLIIAASNLGIKVSDDREDHDETDDN